MERAHIRVAESRQMMRAVMAGCLATSVDRLTKARGHQDQSVAHLSQMDRHRDVARRRSVG